MPEKRRRDADESAELVAIYQCLCDETRLRILSLLANAGRLCVCHFQGLLDKSQVQVSKHLRYLKDKGLVEATKRANWMIYGLPARRSSELDANLRCLQDCVQTHAIFKRDLKRLKELRPELLWLTNPGDCAARGETCSKPGREFPVSKRTREQSRQSR